MFLLSVLLFIVTGCVENAATDKKPLLTAADTAKTEPGNQTGADSQETAAPENDPRDESLAFKFFNAIEDFRQKVDENWYIKNAVTVKHKIIKYFNAYQSRLIVDYNAKRVRIDAKLKSDIAQAVEDAFAVDLKSSDSPIFSSEFKKGSAPFLLANLVKKPVSVDKMKIYLISNNDKPYYRVEIPFNDNIRVAEILFQKADPMLAIYAKKYGLPKSFMRAMAKTATSFNSLYYDSDGYKFGLFALGENHLIKEDDNEEISFLEMTDLEKNVDYAGRYFASLKNNQFKRIFDKDILEQLMVVSYVMGSDNLLHLYSRNKQQAVSIINSINGAKFYDDLIKKIPQSVKEFLDSYKQNLAK